MTDRMYVLPKSPSGKWGEYELNLLRNTYTTTTGPVDLASLARALGRNKANVCRKARSLGLTNQRRKKVDERKTKPPRKYATDTERNAATSVRVKNMWKTKPHPRGALGMKHSAEAKAKISERSRKSWGDPGSGHHTEERKQKASDEMMRRIAQGSMNNGYSRTRGGRRDDLDGRYFRSAWEANYARYLNFLVANGEISGWDYECKTFVFEKISRGTRAYTPDFRVDNVGGGHEWHEVKGWMDQPSRTRLDRMARYFPDEKIVLIDTTWFRAANKTLGRLIPGWENGTVR